MSRRAGASPRSGSLTRTLGARAGYALITVVWILFGTSALALTAATAARLSARASQNRIALTRSGWVAAACLAEVRFRVDSLLRSWSVSGAAAVRGGWQALPDVDGLRPESIGATCDVGWEPVGARPDVNAATAPTVWQLLIAVGVGPATADSMSAALADWMDPDTAARHHGAEVGWYRKAGRLPPANGPFMDLSQIRAVRGFESGAFDSLFSLEAGPVALNHATPALLSTLPGFGDEAVAAVVRRRRSGLPVASIEELARELSPAAASNLRRASSTLAGQISLDASAWILRIGSADSILTTKVFVEARLERRGATIGLSRYRTWVR